MVSDSAPSVAVIGLGAMGFGIARSLLRAGLPVAGCDIDPRAQARLEAEGGRFAPNPRAAAEGADIALVVVVNADQSRQVLFADEGAAGAMKPDGVIVSCATMSPDDARGLAEEAGGQGLLFLDAPISGGRAGAESGKLTVMASGPGAAFERARPALSAIARKVYELGEEAGIGASFKIVNQLLAGVHIASACEAMTFAKRLGLDLDKVYEVIRGSAGNSWMFENRMPHVLQGDYSPASAVEIFVKDLGIVADLGRDRRYPLPVAGAALQLFLMTAAAGMGRDDDSSVARLYARIAGLELPGDG